MPEKLMERGYNKKGRTDRLDSGDKNSLFPFIKFKMICKKFHAWGILYQSMFLSVI